MDVRQVPGGGWATWNSPPAVESSTPKVLAVTTGLTSFTITLGTPFTVFGFELEPNNGTQSITATYYNSATVLGTITRSVVGTSGALLFAASSSTPITSVVLTVPAGASGFAMAQIRHGSLVVSSALATPALGMPAMGGLAMALLAAGVLLARRRQLDQV
jgi:hypothetical protein